jgi:hypothetical protein
VDITGLGSLTTAGVLLALLVRSLWRTDGSWQTLLAEERTRATNAHHDAIQAQADARAAREEAAAARRATEKCEIEHEITRHDLNRVIRHLADKGIPLPPDADA